MVGKKAAIGGCWSGVQGTGGPVDGGFVVVLHSQGRMQAV